jgi:hypothetical protein
MGKAKRFKATIEQHPENASVFFDVPFDPKAELGKVRAPVRVTINGFTFPTTIASMGGRTFIGLNKANREGTGVKAGQTVNVLVELDEAPRVVTVPADLKKALSKSKKAKAGWERLSYTHQREHVQAIEEAKKPETRARRIEKCVAMLEA